MKREDRGFTLIELMVVVVIIGILGVVALNTFVLKGEKAKWDATKGIIAKIAGQVDSFKLDHNKYPDKLEDLLARPSYVDPSAWRGGYVKKREELQDAWKKDLIYRVPGSQEEPYDLVSFGADGEEGGDGNDEDIWNHDNH